MRMRLSMTAACPGAANSQTLLFEIVLISAQLRTGLMQEQGAPLPQPALPQALLALQCSLQARMEDHGGGEVLAAKHNSVVCLFLGKTSFSSLREESGLGRVIINLGHFSL